MGSTVIALNRKHLILQAFLKYLLKSLPPNSTLPMSKLLHFMKLLPMGAFCTQSQLQAIIRNNKQVQQVVRYYLDDIFVATTKVGQYIETI